MASIVVVGGGAAGLVCAWRLQRAGHDVEVLERESAVGGRLRSEPSGDFQLPLGASFVTRGQRNVLGVITALGLDESVVWLDADDGSRRAGRRSGEGAARGCVPGAIVSSGQLEECQFGRGLGLLRSPLLSPGSRLRVARLAAQVVRQRQQLDPLQPERAARLEDGEDLPQFAARSLGVAARDRLLTPILGAVLGCEPEDVSATFSLLTLRSLAQGAAPLTLEGGLAQLIGALAEALPLRTGCEVSSVETQTGGARVRFRGAGRERTAVADAVVMAVPGPLVPRLCPKLTPDERGFFESVRYASGIQVHLLLEKQPVALAPFSLAFARGEGSGLRALFQNHRTPTAAPEGAGLLTAALPEKAVRRFASKQDDEDVVAYTLDAIERTPFGRLSPMDAVVHRWPHARPVYPSGTLSRLETFGVRIDRSPRLVFAGDYLIGPTVEGALTSGMQAASRVIRALEQGA
jgi:oxygen-dependent protoporphyrinogen oxidase